MLNEIDNVSRPNDILDSQAVTLSHFDDVHHWRPLNGQNGANMTNANNGHSKRPNNGSTELVANQFDFTEQLTVLKQVLGDWFNSHRDRLKEAYLRTSPVQQTFVVVLKGRQYDEQIEESLTNLTIEIANHPHLEKIKLDVQCLPDCGMDDIRSFIAMGGERSDGLI